MCVTLPWWRGLIDFQRAPFLSTNECEKLDCNAVKICFLHKIGRGGTIFLNPLQLSKRIDGGDDSCHCLLAAVSTLGGPTINKSTIQLESTVLVGSTVLKFL